MPDPVAEYLRRFGNGGGLMAPPVPPKDPVQEYLKRFGPPAPYAGMEPETQAPARLPEVGTPPPALSGIRGAMTARVLGEQLASAQRAVRRGAVGLMPPKSATVTPTPELPEPEPFAVSHGAGRSWGGPPELPKELEPVENRGLIGELYRGFAGGSVGMNPAMVGATLETYGAEGVGGAVSKFGEKQSEKFRARVPSLRDIKSADDAIDWAAYATGQSVASSAPSVVGGLMGAAIGQAAIPIPLVGAAIGGFVGAMGPAFAMNAGDVADELDRQLEEAGVEISEGKRRQIVTLGGALTGAFDLPLAGYAAQKLMHVFGTKGPKEVVKKQIVKGVVRRLVGEMGKVALLEGSTEAAQKYAAKYAASRASKLPVLTTQTFLEALDEGAAGAMGGLVFGAGGMATQSYQTRQQERAVRELLGDDVPATAQQVQDMLAEVDAKVKAGGDFQQSVREVLGAYRAKVAAEAAPAAPAAAPEAPVNAPESPTIAPEAEGATPVAPEAPAPSEPIVAPPAKAALPVKVPVAVLTDLREIATKATAKLRRSVRAEGVREPISLSLSPTTGRAVITDGAHRLDAAIREGVAEVPILVRVEELNESVAGVPVPGLAEALGLVSPTTEPEVAPTSEPAAPVAEVVAPEAVPEVASAEVATVTPPALTPEEEALAEIPLPEPEPVSVAPVAPVAPVAETEEEAYDRVSAEVRAMYEAQPVPKVKWVRNKLDGTWEGTLDDGGKIYLEGERDGSEWIWTVATGSEVDEGATYESIGDAKDAVAEAVRERLIEREVDRRLAPPPVPMVTTPEQDAARRKQQRRLARMAGLPQEPFRAPTTETVPEIPAEVVGPQTALPAPALAAGPVQPKPHRKPTKKEEVVLGHILPKAQNATVMDGKALAAYFTPGEIVEGYGGHPDRVLAYSPTAGVTVQEVDEQGQPVPGTKPRVHRTIPSRKEWERVMRTRATTVAPEVAPLPRPLPSLAEATAVAEAMYNRPGITDTERRNQFLRGYQDAAAGRVEERQAAKAGTPYAEGYDLYASAKKAADLTEATVAKLGAVTQEVARILPTQPGPRAVVGNVELTSNRDARMARFGELPEETQKVLQHQAIEEILKPIARSMGLPADVVDGLGSWFSEGFRSVNRAGRMMFPAGTPAATVREFMARASVAMKQAGYFAVQRAQTDTGIWALELNFNRPLTEAEYRNIVETISVGATTFNGTTMIGLDPARTVIVLNEGMGHADAVATTERIGGLLPNETIDAETYQVEIVARDTNEDADYAQDIPARGEAVERVDREAAAVHERIAARVAAYFERADAAARGERTTPARLIWGWRSVAQQSLTKWLAGFTGPGTGRFSFSQHYAALAQPERDELARNVQAALRDEFGRDRIASLVNDLLGGQVVVVDAAGGIHPEQNPTGLVTFQNLPTDPGQAREWLRRYLAIRGIVLGMDSEASFRLVGSGHGGGEFDGFIVPMTLAQFHEVARKLDGATYDPDAQEATFIDFRGKGAEYAQSLVAWLEAMDGDFVVSPASFEGEQHGPRDFFTAIGRDWKTLQSVARLLTEHVAPALRASAGASAADFERVARVSTGLVDLAAQYYAPSPRGQRRVVAIDEALRKLARTYRTSVLGQPREEQVKVITRRLNQKFRELLPKMQADLGLTDEQVRDWYHAGAGLQRSILTLIQPELANDADWVLATAIHSILSNGNEVAIETELGSYIYEQFLLTGEITYLDPATAVRGEYMVARERAGKPVRTLARFATGETGTGIGGQDLYLSRRWLTHEVGLRRLHKLVATVGKEEAARWLQGSWTRKNGTVVYHALELLGPKIGQYLLDKQGLANQGSAIDVWIGRLYDILAGAPEIAKKGKVTPEKRAVMQEVFRNFVGADNPSAAQAISWYLTKYLYRLAGTSEKPNAYATLPHAAAELLAGGRETGGRGQTGTVSIGTPKTNEVIARRPTAGWVHDSKWETIAKREGWDRGFETDLTLLGLTARELRDMASDAIGGAKRSQGLIRQLATLVQQEALAAYGKLEGLATYLSGWLYDTVKAQGSYTVDGVPTPYEVLQTMERLTKQSRGLLNIIGQTIDTPATLHRLMRAFRDPRFEHAHILLVDDSNQIVFHSMETIGSPFSCNLSPANFRALLGRAATTGATKVILAHNHPSGNTEPSPADKSSFLHVSAILDEAGLDVAWSQVIDHDETSILWFGPKGPTVASRVIVETDQAEDWTNYTKDKPSITTASEVAAIVRASLQPGAVSVLFCDPHQRVMAATQLPAEAFAHEATTKYRWLIDLVDKLGAYSVQIVMQQSESPGLSFQNVAAAMERFALLYGTFVWDVVNLTPGGNFVISARAAGLLQHEFRNVHGQPSIASTIMMDEPLRPPVYDASILKEGDPSDPRVAGLASPDIVERVFTALAIERGNLQYHAEQIRQAVIAAKLFPPGPGGHVVPAGRAAYAAERFMEDVLPVEPKHDEAVKSPERIVRELQEGLDLPILATGRRWAALRQPGVTGAYKVFSRVARLRQRGDIETAVHEVGHHIHELLYGLTSTLKLKVRGIPKSHRDELIAMARTGRAVSAKATDADALREGVAEFYRRFVTNPQAAALQAPHYHGFVLQTLERDHPHILRALLKARADLELWRTGTDAARIRARIHSAAEPDVANPNKGVWDRFMEGGVNDLHYIEKIDRQHLPAGAPVRQLPHLIAQLMRGHAGAADYWIRFGSADWATREKRGPSLEAIIRPIFEAGQREDFTTYIVARRGRERLTVVRERDAQGNPTKVGFDVGFDLATAESVIRQYETPEFADAFDKLAAYNRHLLEMLRDAGVISATDFANIEATGGIDEYVPFHRVMAKWQGTRDKNLFLSRKVVKRFTGDNADIIDPLESMIKNTYNFVMAAWQQEVGEALAHLSEQEGAGKLLDRITPALQVEGREFGDLWDQVNQQMGGALPGLSKQTRETLVKIFRPGDFFGKKNVISIIRNGQREWYEVVDPDLFMALTGLGREQLGNLTRLAAFPSQWRRAGAVLAPEFVIRNPLRDQMTAMINSEYGYIPFYDLARGVFHLLTKQNSDMYRRWKLSGGEYAAMVDLDRAGRQKHLDDLVRRGKVVQNVVHPRSWLHSLQAFSALMENGTRLGEFINALEEETKKGTADAEAMDRAALASREISTDYARHGAKTAALRAIATFWNAGLQGDVRTVKAFKHHPKEATLKAFAFLTIPSILLALANSDDDEYWEIPQWERDLFWLLKVPVDWIPDFMQQTEDSGAVGRWFKPFVASKGGVWLRFPKPFGLGQVFGTIPERIVEWLHNNDPEGLKETAENLLPTSLTGSPLFGGVPDIAAIQPLIEAWMNRSRFMQRPLVPRVQQGIVESEQYTERTSEFAKAVAKGAGYAKDLPGVGDILKGLGLTVPAKVDNYFRSWTAGLGGYATQVTDMIVRPGLRALDPDAMGGPPAKEISDIPLVKALAARSPTWQSESIERFYTEYSRLQVLQQTEQYHEGSRKLHKALNFRRRHMEDLVKLQYFEQVAGQLKAFRQFGEFAESSDMSPAQKREILNEYGRFATELAASALGRPYRSQNTERPAATWR